jgi:hypothetical protein
VFVCAQEYVCVLYMIYCMYIPCDVYPQFESPCIYYTTYYISYV